MRTLRFVFAILFLLLNVAGSSPSDDPLPLQQILEHHVEALGGREKLDAVQSVVLRFEYREADFVMPHAYMAKMRPYYKTICDPNEKPGDICEGYDGSAWEWYADPGVVLRTVGPAAAAARHGIDLFDSLVEYKSGRTRIDLAGTGMFDAKPVYRLHVALTDGYEKEVFVDAQSFLILGERRAAPIHAFGQTVSSEIHYSEFRAVNGVLFPSLEKEVETATGRELNRESIESVIVNDVKLSSSSFGPPQRSPTAFQLFLEQLYMERTDPISVIYTYRDFRAAKPDVNTRDGIEFIGYQMTKMGDYKGAIALLKANAADYPKAASAQYGLGRAYKAAGQINHAQDAFHRALQIDPNFKKARDGLDALR